MKRVRGFTLVELLVVMAIIAILASIVVPNVVTYIAKARATEALSEIKSIELAITRMIADADRSNLSHLFDSNEVATYLGFVPGTFLSRNQFLRAQSLYTRTLYALLRDGRGALTATDTTLGPNFIYGNVLKDEVVLKLGGSYLDLGFDPWGSLYNMYPGPWMPQNGPNVFRTYLTESTTASNALPGRSGAGQEDPLTLNQLDFPSLDFVDSETGLPLVVSYPGERNKAIFVWSAGSNLISGQAIYQPPAVMGGVQYVANQSGDYYDSNQDVFFMGGGDDVNNWDNTQSWGRFYN